MEFLIALIFFLAIYILTIFLEIIDKIKQIIKRIIENCNYSYDYNPLYYTIIDDCITEKNKDKIQIIEILSPTNEKKYLCVGSIHNLKVKLVEIYGNSDAYKLKLYESSAFNTYLEYLEKLQNSTEQRKTLENNAENIEDKRIKRRLQKEICKMSEAELKVTKEEIDKDIIFYNSMAKYKWKQLVGNDNLDDNLDNNLKNKLLSEIKPSTKKKCNLEEEYYCENCFKKISYEDYELYDGMCEDCFEDEFYCKKCFKPIPYEIYETYDGMCEDCFEDTNYKDDSQFL